MTLECPAYQEPGYQRNAEAALCDSDSCKGCLPVCSVSPATVSWTKTHLLHGEGRCLQEALLPVVHVRLDKEGAEA